MQTGSLRLTPSLWLVKLQDQRPGGVALPVINRIAEFADEVAGWRRDFHAFPELMYDVHRTAGRVEELLRSFGVDDVATGIGRTGVVGVIDGRSPGKVIGLRADMDALPIVERTGRPYESRNPGKMHACGHDGHMAMLLGAAKCAPRVARRRHTSPR